MPTLQNARLTTTGRLLAAALCVLAASGCTTVKGWFSGGKKDAASEPAALVEFTPSLQVAKVWEVKTGKPDERAGLFIRPATRGDRVYVNATRGGVEALDLATGKTVWHYDTKARLGSGPAVDDGLVAVGGLDGEVIVLDADTGAQKWTAKVNNEIIAAPAIGQGLVVVRSNDGRVTAFDAANGERRWFWDHSTPSLSLRGNASPVLVPGGVFVANDDGTVSALSTKDGAVQWTQEVGVATGRNELQRLADVDGTPLFDNGVLYATSQKQVTMALDPASGRPQWSYTHGGPGALGLGPDRLVVSDPEGHVWAIDRGGGGSLWQQDKLANRGLGAPAVIGNYAVLGDAEGYVHWLRLETGEFAARERIGKAPIRAQPLVAGDLVLVQSSDGDLVAYRPSL